MGTVKARDIIPGWPKGRSTSNMGSGNSARDFMETGIRWPSWAWTVIGDPRFTEDVEGERAEERRKADMMEAFWVFTGEEVVTILIPRQKLDDNTPDHPTSTLTEGRGPEPVLCEEERRKEKD